MYQPISSHMDPFQTKFHDLHKKCFGPGPSPGQGLGPGPGPGFSTLTWSMTRTREGGRGGWAGRANGWAGRGGVGAGGANNCPWDKKFRLFGILRKK